MKRIYIYLSVLLLCLVGCDDQSVFHPVELPIDPNYPVLLDEGVGYSIFTDESESSYYYVVYDVNGQILGQNTTTLRNLRGDHVTDHVLRLDMDANFSNRCCMFFDRKTGTVSQFYSKVVAEKNGRVAYFAGDKVTGEIYLAIEDYFNPQEYSVRITDQSYTRDILEAECFAHFSDDMRSIAVAYIDWDGRVIWDTYTMANDTGDGSLCGPKIPFWYGGI